MILRSSKRRNKALVYIFFLLPVLIVSCVNTGRVAHSSPQIEDSPLKTGGNSLILTSWNAYKKGFIHSDGRVIDHSIEKITTSEGQSYALLRAVWIGDRETFDNVLSWTLNNLKQKDTHLFSWKWGKKYGLSWGVLDSASATDADQDIALALILAHKKWGAARYMELARYIINDIWSFETREVKGQRYMVAGDWAGKKKEVTINPSYLAPYAYRMFGEIDTSHKWTNIVNTSYEVIYRCSEPSRVFLPPDWCRLTKDGEIVLPDIFDKGGDTSYGAFRVYWRLALDYTWFGEERAIRYIRKGGFLIDYWHIKGSITASYTRDGIARSDSEALSIYGIILPFFAINGIKYADDLYDKKIAPSYKEGFWGNQEAYYAQNWVWFGIALYHEIKEGKK